MNQFTSPAIIVEGSSNFTLGHASKEGGLRGHSLGDLFPFRVVCVGDKWQVHYNDRAFLGVYQGHANHSIGAAHALAEQMKRSLVALGRMPFKVGHLEIR